MEILYDAVTLHAPVRTCTHTQSKHYLATGYTDPRSCFAVPTFPSGAKSLWQVSNLQSLVPKTNTSSIKLQDDCCVSIDAGIHGSLGTRVGIF